MTYKFLNVNGGSISIGDPYGLFGSRMVGHALIEGKRRGAKYAVCKMYNRRRWRSCWPFLSCLSVKKD